MVNVFVLALLHTSNNVLLVHRVGASFGDGLYSIVGGKVEKGETARQAIHREVLEETLLDIPESAFKLVHTLHRRGTETELIALCFTVDVTDMPKPYNNEPAKHNDMQFFVVDKLPENMIPAHRQIINCVQKGTNYSNTVGEHYE